MRIIGVSLGIAALALALALAGCATQGGFGVASRPKTVVVSDFIAASEVTALDRGYSARLERKGGNFPILERNRRTLARVNDEIVASVVANLREAGFDAHPGSEEGLSFSDDALVIKGRLRPSDKLKPNQMNQVGFGGGRRYVVADMTVSRFTYGRKEQVLTFATDGTANRKPANAKTAAATNAAIAAALAAQQTPAEKLSPDVEAPARRLGVAIGEKVAAFAKEKWTDKPEPVAAAAPGAEAPRVEPPPAAAEPDQPESSTN